MLQQRALLGLAQVHEALGDVAKAKEQYHRIATTWSHEPAAELANRRLEFVGRKDTAAFLEWFAEQKVEPSPPPTLGSPKAPSINDDLPSAEDLRLPNLDDLKRSFNMEVNPPNSATEPPRAPETPVAPTDPATDLAPVEANPPPPATTAEPGPATEAAPETPAPGTTIPAENEPK